MLCEVGFGVQEAISGKLCEIMQCNTKIENGVTHDKKRAGKDCSLNLMKKCPPSLKRLEAMSVFLPVGLNKEDINDSSSQN